MKYILSILLTLIVGDSLAAPLHPADFYVSPAGADHWSGKLAEPNEAKSDGPFATLIRARCGAGIQEK